jgi:hypothetical protein
MAMVLQDIPNKGTHFQVIVHDEHGSDIIRHSVNPFVLNNPRIA